MNQHGKVQLESVPPRFKRRLDSSEVFMIPLLPDPPSCHFKNFQEHRTGPSGLALMQHSEPVSVIWPLYPQSIPASLTEGAGKEEVNHVFLRRVVAEKAGVVIVPDFVMSSPEHISSVQSVSQQQQQEYLPLHCTFGFPDPAVCLINLYLAKTVGIVL